MSSVFNAAVCTCVVALLAPLTGALLAGLCGARFGRRFAHSVTISGVLLACVAAAYLCWQFAGQTATPVDVDYYTWLQSGRLRLSLGCLLDPLTTIMMVVVTSISLLVHLYSVGYMHDDPGYARFFCYVSLFTFAMLLLVTANNFVQLFFGWEGVGVVSYLLIGFWFDREAAVRGGLKAFLVNRVGDLGFILGMAALFSVVGSLHYAPVFAARAELLSTVMPLGMLGSHTILAVACACLFIGAMGKSAQIPLHVWLPESMEGPTPISALIHAATMVTAGIFMIARCSTLFHAVPAVANVILIVGATGALALGLVGIVQFDIKRVVAYSTLSQLGYMIAATGASAYDAGLFHLVTHACFKALLFLAAGSVIIGCHHEQDMRNMGGLWRRMPVTYVTFLIGTLALIAVPPAAGFYSKDAIIAAVSVSKLPGAGYAYVCLVLGAGVTALYSVRALILTFHGHCRAAHPEDIHETPWTMTLPLVVLAVPSLCLGALLLPAMLGNGPNVLGSAVVHGAAEAVHSRWHMILHALHTAPFWLMVLGSFAAVLFYGVQPTWPAIVAARLAWLHKLLVQRYGFDAFNDRVLLNNAHRLSRWFYRGIDARLIDSWGVHGSARGVQGLARLLRLLQTGYVYHYAFAMVLGLLGLLIWAM